MTKATQAKRPDSAKGEPRLTSLPTPLRSAKVTHCTVVLATALLLACGSDDQKPAPTQGGAAIDVHLHLASPELTDFLKDGSVDAPTAAELVALLDEGNVERGVVLAPGYMAFPEPRYMTNENDYVAAQIADFSERLIGFCGINPRLEGAVDEVSRCLKLPGMVGVKLHLPGSEMDLDDPEQAAQLAAVFDRIEAEDAPVLMHVGDVSSQPLTSAAFEALSEIINSHPSVRITHAHCAGNVDDATIESWLRVPGAGYNENSFVDTSACLKFYRDAPLATRELIVWRFRKWGIERVLLGSDYISFEPEETPAEAIETLRQYPFTEEEIGTILSNDGSAWLGM